jgi:hypothetical protein
MRHPALLSVVCTKTPSSAFSWLVRLPARPTKGLPATARYCENRAEELRNAMNASATLRGVLLKYVQVFMVQPRTLPLQTPAPASINV